MLIILVFFLFIVSSGPSNIPESNWPLGLELEFKIPEQNPLTQQKVRLGERLFFDKRLSRDESLSCATCHDPQKGFSNGLKVAEGVSGAKGERNVPSVFNRLYGSSEFWDGRAANLEDQALGPLFNPNEMAMDETLMLERLNADVTYQRLFYDAFGSPEPTVEGVSKALASFQRTLLTGASAFDVYEWDGVSTALSDTAKRGLSLFRGKAGCSTCHTGTNLTDEKYHNLGAGEGAGQHDIGRAGVTGNPEDTGKFKTPTLRNVQHTAPYMHDGSLASLADVIEFYDQGGRPNPHLDEEIKPLQLSDAEQKDLLAFLMSLTARVYSVNVQEIKAHSQ